MGSGTGIRKGKWNGYVEVENESGKWKLEVGNGRGK